MRWIGQFIQQFVARFRSDVYLEGTEYPSGASSTSSAIGVRASKIVGNDKITLFKSSSDMGEVIIKGAATNDKTTITRQFITNNRPPYTSSSSRIEFSPYSVLGSPIAAHIQTTDMKDVNDSANINGQDMIISAGGGAGANKVGGNLILTGGRGTGTASSGNLVFLGKSGGSAGSNYNDPAVTDIVFKANGSGGILVNGECTLEAITASGVIKFTSLPTSDPTVAGQLWNDSGTLKVSAG